MWKPLCIESFQGLGHIHMVIFSYAKSRISFIIKNSHVWTCDEWLKRIDSNLCTFLKIWMEYHVMIVAWLRVMLFCMVYWIAWYDFVAIKLFRTIWENYMSTALKGMECKAVKCQRGPLGDNPGTMATMSLCLFVIIEPQLSFATGKWWKILVITLK